MRMEIKMKTKENDKKLKTTQKFTKEQRKRSTTKDHTETN